MIAKVYAWLRDMKDGSATIEELAHELRMSKTAIRKALAKLEEDGCIAVSKEEA